MKTTTTNQELPHAGVTLAVEHQDLDEAWQSAIRTFNVECSILARWEWLLRLESLHVQRWKAKQQLTPDSGAKRKRSRVPGFVPALLSAGVTIFGKKESTVFENRKTILSLRKKLGTERINVLLTTGIAQDGTFLRKVAKVTEVQAVSLIDLALTDFEKAKDEADLLNGSHPVDLPKDEDEEEPEAEPMAATDAERLHHDAVMCCVEDFLRDNFGIELPAEAFTSDDPNANAFREAFTKAQKQLDALRLLTVKTITPKQLNA